MTIREEIQKQLFALQDEPYRNFQCRLIPNVEPGSIIGIRTPALRKYAKELAGNKEIGEFLRAVPHTYFDENQLHAFILSEDRDFEHCIEEVDRFLPYVNNWATCDQLSPKVFRRKKEMLPEHIDRWIASDKTYAVRFGIGMLMTHFLDEAFDMRFPRSVAAVQTEEYYVKMMIAWYFATALAKQYDRILPFIEEKRLESWTHNKAIQKAVESYRITEEQKAYLKTLRIPGRKGA